ncbi:MAG: hypothetical protein AB1488_06580 [Nitrospirota bacterium]
MYYKTGIYFRIISAVVAFVFFVFETAVSFAGSVGYLRDGSPDSLTSWARVAGRENVVMLKIPSREITGQIQSLRLPREAPVMILGKYSPSLGMGYIAKMHLAYGLDEVSLVLEPIKPSTDTLYISQGWDSGDVEFKNISMPEFMWIMAAEMKKNFSTIAILAEEGIKQDHFQKCSRSGLKKKCTSTVQVYLYPKDYYMAIPMDMGPRFVSDAAGIYEVGGVRWIKTMPGHNFSQEAIKIYEKSVEMKGWLGWVVVTFAALMAIAASYAIGAILGQIGVTSAITGTLTAEAGSSTLFGAIVEVVTGVAIPRGIELGITAATGAGSAIAGGVDNFNAPYKKLLDPATLSPVPFYPESYYPKITSPDAGSSPVHGAIKNWVTSEPGIEGGGAANTFNKENYGRRLLGGRTRVTGNDAYRIKRETQRSPSESLMEGEDPIRWQEPTMPTVIWGTGK